MSVAGKTQEDVYITHDWRSADVWGEDVDEIDNERLQPGLYVVGNKVILRSTGEKGEVVTVDEEKNNYEIGLFKPRTNGTIKIYTDQANLQPFFDISMFTVKHQKQRLIRDNAADTKDSEPNKRVRFDPSTKKDANKVFKEAQEKKTKDERLRAAIETLNDPTFEDYKSFSPWKGRIYNVNVRLRLQSEPQRTFQHRASEIVSASRAMRNIHLAPLITINWNTIILFVWLCMRLLLNYTFIIYNFLHRNDERNISNIWVMHTIIFCEFIVLCGWSCYLLFCIFSLWRWQTGTWCKVVGEQMVWFAGFSTFSYLPSATDLLYLFTRYREHQAQIYSQLYFLKSRQRYGFVAKYNSYIMVLRLPLAMILSIVSILSLMAKILDFQFISQEDWHDPNIFLNICRYLAFLNQIASVVNKDEVAANAMEYFMFGMQHWFEVSVRNRFYYQYIAHVVMNQHGTFKSIMFWGTINRDRTAKLLLNRWKPKDEEEPESPPVGGSERKKISTIDQ